MTRRLITNWLHEHERESLVAILTIAIALRVLLVTFSPTPFGYVWDFYHEGVRILWSTGHLPASTDCWQCYHPPLFYLVGLPLYALGRFTGRESGAIDVQGLRWLAGLGMVGTALTIYYGYSLLRLFRCRGGSLLIGTALLTSFPVLFISSYGAEADILLTAILSAFIYYFARDFVRSGSTLAAVRLGILAGAAAATKYSGLVAVVSAMIFFAIRVLSGPRRVLALRNAAIVGALCVAIGGWKYVDNYRRYRTALYANGSAQQGFSFATRRAMGRHYEFNTFRISELMHLFGARAVRGALNDVPVYRSVFTTLHALTWTDMSFFSQPDRHGDPTHPYQLKEIPTGAIGAVLLLGFVPEALAAIGFVATIRRRVCLPLVIVCVVGVSAYVWWFVSQESWALKTKYLLFLVPPFVVYATAGLAVLWNRAPHVGIVAAVLTAALIGAANVYLLAFAIA